MPGGQVKLARKNATTVSVARLLLAFALASSCLLRASLAAAQSQDPRWIWRSIHSEHFDIHYPLPLGLLARRVAALAERTHRRLMPLIGHRPRERTQIVLRDDSESANGSANVLPYNAIHLYVTAPEDLSPLNDYDDWFHLLVTHEHTHILHLDQIRGLPALVNTLLGKVYAPNQLQPRWFIEGYAVYEESARSAGGRLRSSIFDMYLRMDALEGRMLRLDQASHVVDRWPHFDTAYLYGARFVDFIARHYGEEALRKMAGEYGRRFIPYALNRTARRFTGRTFVELYDLFLREVRTRYEAVRRQVEGEGKIEGVRLTEGGEEAYAPCFLDSRRLVYYAQDNRTQARLRLHELGGKERNLLRVAGIAYPACDAARGRVYFHAIETFRYLHPLNDLFVYDFAKGRKRRLTQGLRAREVSLSPDGKTLAYALNSASTSHLLLGDADDPQKTARILLRNPRFEQIYTPRFSPDGRYIAFSAWRKGGYRDIEIIEVATAKVRRITHDRALDTGPTWSPDGKRLYFSSDRSGIANIHAYDFESGETLQITRVLGGAFQPAISPDGKRLVYVGYRSRGYDLYALDLETLRPGIAPHSIDRRPEPSPEVQPLLLASSRYRPAPTLWPRAYALDLRPNSFGQELGVSLRGSDVVGWHRYYARLGVGLKRGETNVDLQWTYNRSLLPLSLRLFRRITQRGGLVVGGEPRPWIEESYGGDLGVSYSFLRALYANSLRLNYSLAHIGKAEPFGGILDPNTPPPVLPETGLLASMRAGWSYSDARRQLYDISPSYGRVIDANLTLSDPVIGSQYRTLSLSWSFQRYLRMPWGHILAFRYGGGHSFGDLGRRGTFAVGGFLPVDLWDTLVEGSVLGGIALRGYPPFSRAGTRFHLGQLEYRFPIYRPQLGYATLPLFIHRMYGGTFVDYGDAYSGRIDFRRFRTGVGLELLLDFTLGYFQEMTLRSGFAYGLNEGGGPQGYVNLGVPF